MDPTCDLLWLVPDGYGCVTAVRVFRAGTWSRQPGAKHHLSVWLDGEFATVHAADCRALAPGAAFVRDGLPMYAAAPPRKSGWVFGEHTERALQHLMNLDGGVTVAENRDLGFTPLTREQAERLCKLVTDDAPSRGILADGGGADEPVVVGG